MARSSKTTKSNKKGVYPAQLKGKGFDAHPEHINRAGRIPPKDVRELNDLIDEILAEEISDSSGQKMQKIRVLLNRLILSKTPVGQIHILDRRFGKVPDKVDLSNTDGRLKPETLKPSEIAERVAQLLLANKKDDAGS